MEDFRLDNLLSLNLHEMQLCLDEVFPGHRVLQVMDEEKTVTRIKGPLINVTIKEND